MNKLPKTNKNVYYLQSILIARSPGTGQMEGGAVKRARWSACQHK